MKKLLLLTTILLVSVGWAVAQQTNPSTSPEETPGAQTPGTPGARPGIPGQATQQPGMPGQTTQQPGMPGQTEEQPGLPSSSQSGQESSSTAASGNTVEGCLGGSAGNFTVTDKAGTTYRLQIPAGADTSKLNQHVGEQVRVTGSMSNSSQSSGAVSQPSSSGSSTAGASGSQSSIAVTKIDKIGDKCSASAASPGSNTH